MNPDTLANLREQILETLRHFGARSLHVGELRGRLGLPKDQHAVLFGILEQMSEEGLLDQLPGGRFRARKGGKRKSTKPPPEVGPDKSQGRGRGRKESERRAAERNAAQGNSQPESSLDLRTGVLVINARGFGFVSTVEDGPDVFVPAVGLSCAMHGDRVEVRVRPSSKGLEGRVKQVLARGTEYVSGQLYLAGDNAFIESDDERIRYPIHVTGKLPDAARTGQGVIAKVEHYPAHIGDRIEATIVESFDPKQFVEFETKRILFREGAIETFSEEALAEAQALPTRVPERDKRGRVDLRKLDLVTIDPDDAKDHDDAVYAERLDKGCFRVIVAIADVSHYVPEGSALDLEAQARGCTIYLPSKAIPMLPHEISSNLASLVPNRDRLALAVEAVVGPQGAVRSYQLHEAVVRSHARLTYAGVARALGLTEDGPKQKLAESRLPMLQTLMDVAAVLGGKRRRRGSLEFDLPEAKVKLETSTGRPLDVLRSRSDPGIRKAYNMIEELALLANEVVAADLTKRKLPCIYRVHAPPDEDRVAAFTELANSLGFKLEVEEARNPKKLARFLVRMRKTEHSETLGYLLLRAMQQATYDTHNVGHFGLAAPEYVHFTSPIRRYPDLAVHRIVRQVARGERVRTHGLRDKLAGYAEASSKLERRAMLMEREVVDLYRAMIMEDRVGEIFPATITGITDHGIFASIDSPYVDVLCRIATFPRDDWETDPFGIRLTGLRTGMTFALGGRLEVKVEDVSLARRRVSAIPTQFVGLQSEESAPYDDYPKKNDGQRRRKRDERRDGKSRDQRREGDGQAEHKKRRTGGQGRDQEQRDRQDRKSERRQKRKDRGKPKKRSGKPRKKRK